MYIWPFGRKRKRQHLASLYYSIPVVILELRFQVGYLQCVRFASVVHAAIIVMTSSERTRKRYPL